MFTALALLIAQANPPAPAFVGTKWLNAAPITWEARKGKVTVVEFWTFGCINCKHNLPIYARWQAKYGPKGVEIVGVHSPETESEKMDANVKAAVKEKGITYPVLIDTKMENWNRWRCRYWPTVFLIDRKGTMRQYWEGELNYGEYNGEALLGKEIERLLAE